LKETAGMIARIIGAIIGSQVARHSRSIGGPLGAVLGMVALPLVRRLNLPGMLLLGAAGYVGRKLLDRRQRRQVGGRPGRWF
jgi:hypothetical protein